MTKWTPTIVVQSLQVLHQPGTDLSYSAMARAHSRLLDAARHIYGTYAKALAAAGIDYTRFIKHQRWSRPRVIAQIRELQRQGQDLSYRALERHNRFLIGAAKKHFGSHANALRAVGIDPATVAKRQIWTRQRITAQIRALHRQGADLRYRVLRKRIPTLLSAARSHFGAYARALAAAGLDYSQINPIRHWDQQAVLQELRRWKKLGKDLRSGRIRVENTSLLNAAKGHFGSYENALHAAGIEYDRIRQTRVWTRESILAILTAENRAGRNLNSTAIRQHHPSLPEVCRHHFGSYRKAVEAAGFDYLKVRHFTAWSKPIILARLQALDRAGRDMRYVAMNANASPLLCAARFYFGTYRNAIQAAGLDYPPLKPLPFWTRPKVLKTLQRLHGDGVDLRYAQIKTTHQALFAAARYYFGKYHRAVAAAGINYAQMLAKNAARQPAPPSTTRPSNNRSAKTAPQIFQQCRAKINRTKL